MTEEGAGVGELVPDDDTDGAGYRSEGTPAASSAHEPTVALAQECVGPRRGGRDLSQDALEGFPLPTPPERLPGPDWIVRGESVAHDTRCAAVGN